MRRFLSSALLAGLILTPFAAARAQEPQPAGQSHPYGGLDAVAGYPPWVAEYVSQQPEVEAALSIGTLIAKPLTFLGLFLFVGLVFGALSRAAAGRMRQHGTPLTEGQGDVLGARARLAAWLLALVVACEAVGLGWVASLGEIAVGLVGAVLHFGAWIVIGLLLAYAISPQGRDLVIGLMGWYYINRARRQAAGGREPLSVELEDGREAVVLSADPLCTHLEVNGREMLQRPNAWVMRRRFGWRVHGGGEPTE
ncbi:MAG: hypothetical protein GF320_04435 [Armatimonadia bacterium]|nr:hypothetical protein [Armatimonadia bacterium]